MTTNSNIPHIVWAYWDQTHRIGKLPLFYQLCMKSWKTHLEGYTINLLSKFNLDKFIPPSELPKYFSTLKVQRKSDVIRLLLLKKYGGIWMDTGIYLNQSISSLISSEKDFTGFYNPYASSAKQGDRTGLENWFLAAVPNCPLITKWSACLNNVFDTYSEKTFFESDIYNNTQHNLSNKHYLFTYLVHLHLMQTDEEYLQYYHNNTHLISTDEKGYSFRRFLTPNIKPDTYNKNSMSYWVDSACIYSQLQDLIQIWMHDKLELETQFIYTSLFSRAYMAINRYRFQTVLKEMERTPLLKFTHFEVPF